MQELILVVDSEPDVDPSEVDKSLRQLRGALRELDVQSVNRMTSPSVPPGAKGDVVGLSALLITLTATGGVLPLLIDTARDWLARHAAARRISVTIDSDTITLEKSSNQERRALIEAYLRRHEVK